MPDSPSREAATRPLRILLADDNRLMLEGLVNLLSAHGIEVLGLANDGLEAVELSRALQPDLILMDVRMPRCSGLEATRLIKARQPEVKIVILTTSAEDADLFESIKSGASGYLIKSMSGNAFIESLRGLEEGIPPFSPGLAARVLSEFARLARKDEEWQTSLAPASQVIADDLQDTEHARLSERQIEVLRLVASGLTYKQVGNRLALSERTVRYHMAEIMERLHLEHRSQVISYAVRQGLEGAQES